MEALYQYIIFDLDGTLIKSEEGLYDSITYALERSGVDPGDRKDMKRMIGPVLWESFQKFYNMSAEEADRANAYFVEAYDKEGLYNVSVYEGVEEMLGTLRNAGRILLVVTAKPRDMAERVLNHTGIDKYFQAVIGPARGNKKTDKGSLLREALSFLAKTEQIIFRRNKPLWSATVCLTCREPSKQAFRRSAFSTDMATGRNLSMPEQLYLPIPLQML